MHIAEAFRSLAAPETFTPAPEARVWACSSRSQVFHAAFEAHEAAVKAGFMPDEATTLSLSLAELGTLSATQGQPGEARVSFDADGWRLEVNGVDRVEPVLTAPLPTPLRHLEVRSDGDRAIVVVRYERRD